MKRRICKNGFNPRARAEALLGQYVSDVQSTRPRGAQQFK
jgi:hypothetical protein